MDERIKAGLKAGAISWVALVTGPLAFFMAGILAGYFGRHSIRNQDDAVVASLVAGMSCMSLYFLFIALINIFIAVFFLPILAGALSLGGGLFYAKYVMKIPVNTDKLKIPINVDKIKDLYMKKGSAHKEKRTGFVRKFCPHCGKRIQTDWKVCPYCKTDLEMNICPCCGVENPSAAVRCRRCGAPLDGTVIYSDDKTRAY